ncbi:hypothetical protein D3C84_911420 [compost metagenome]
MRLGCPAIDFLPGDLAQPRHAGINLKGRFLLGDSQHRAQVLLGRRNILRGKRGIDVRGPALAVDGLGRQQAHDLRLDLGGLARQRFLGALAAAAGQHQQRGDAHDQSMGLHVAPGRSFNRLTIRPMAWPRL